MSGTDNYFQADAGFILLTFRTTSGLCSASTACNMEPTTNQIQSLNKIYFYFELDIQLLFGDTVLILMSVIQCKIKKTRSDSYVFMKITNPYQKSSFTLKLIGFCHYESNTNNFKVSN